MSTAARLALEGELTIFTAQARRDELLTALGAADALEIDLARVTEIDSAGVQLMVAAKREAADQGKTLAFTGHSPAVVEALDLLDLFGHFGDPVLISQA